jgi:DNA-binding transcriptional LysR family regulator
MSSRLPPLTSLRFFEAAGRHLSFKRAAAELHVTPSAVSHGIVTLEQALGTALFIRGTRSLTLTPAGAEYLPYVTEALSLILAGAQRLPKDAEQRRIAISCAPLLASRWLLPRLQTFRRQWPDVTMTIDTSRRQVGFPADGFDFALRMSQTSTAGPAWTRLFGEHLVPVCSPAYREILRASNGQIDLRRATLIHTLPASEEWQAWLDRTGTAGVDPNGGLRMDALQLAFDAAAMGLGVALGRRPLIDSDLETGALIALELETIVAESAYWLVGSDNAESRPDLAGFKRWVLKEANAT